GNAATGCGELDLVGVGAHVEMVAVGCAMRPNRFMLLPVSRHIVLLTLVLIASQLSYIVDRPNAAQEIRTARVSKIPSKSSLTDPSHAASTPSSEQFGNDRMPERLACRIETKKSSSHDHGGDAFSLTDRVPVHVS